LTKKSPKRKQKHIFISPRKSPKKSPKKASPKKSVKRTEIKKCLALISDELLGSDEEQLDEDDDRGFTGEKNYYKAVDNVENNLRERQKKAAALLKEDIPERKPGETALQYILRTAV